MVCGLALMVFLRLLFCIEVKRPHDEPLVMGLEPACFLLCPVRVANPAGAAEPAPEHCSWQSG